METSPSIYLGRRLSPNWYGSLAERLTQLLPDGLSFEPVNNPGLVYVTAEEVRWAYAHKDLDRPLADYLMNQIDILAIKQGPRSMQKRFNSEVHGFRFEEHNGTYRFTVGLRDRLRSDNKWQIGEEMSVLRKRFIKGSGGYSHLPAEEYAGRVTLGIVTPDGELPHFSRLRSAVDGKLLDDIGARPFLQIVTAIPVNTN